jgi:hypothetical protein
MRALREHIYTYIYELVLAQAHAVYTYVV